ncbi:MAG: hypothetical protein JXA64_05145 [Candidatus Fermentibacteraceae bacterium]|nr:hypothetical protein [Candidatus Fermentibacteraceae bacterium]
MGSSDTGLNGETAVDVPLFSFRVEFSIQCPRCDMPVHLDGPVATVHCGSCRSDIDIPRDYWVDTLLGSCRKMQHMEKGGGRGSILLGTFRGDLTLTRVDPCCDRCKTEFIDPWHLEPGTSYVCRQCGIEYPLAAPPEWLRKGVPGIRLLINAVLVEEDPSLKEIPCPVPLSCPSCAATLELDGSSRVIRCSYCGDDVYVPDTIWRKYHPGGRKRRWFVISEFSNEDAEA